MGGGDKGEATVWDRVGRGGWTRAGGGGGGGWTVWRGGGVVLGGELLLEEVGRRAGRLIGGIMIESLRIGGSWGKKMEMGEDLSHHYGVHNDVIYQH